MSIDPFPTRIDPYRFFNRHTSLSSEIALNRFQRLATYLSSQDGVVVTDMEFSRDGQSRRIISGQVKTVVKLTCQRCLQEMDFSIDAKMLVLVADSDEEARLLSDEAEVVVAEEEGIDMMSLLEDELILSLPIVACHDQLCQHPDVGQLGDPVAATRDDEEEKSPFAVLKGLPFGDSNGR